MNRQNAILAADTAAVALLNAAILIVGARVLPAIGINDLAMFQLLVATAVGLQRAALLTPALASQRNEGQTVIPVRWALMFALPTGVFAALTIPLLLAGNVPYLMSLIVGLAVVIPALCQDLLRYCAFSRRVPLLSLGSDLIWLATAATLVPLFLSSTSEPRWFTLSLAWGLGGAVAVAVLGLGLFQRRGTEMPKASLRGALRLGKWSGTDAALSGFANLLPLAVASLALNSPSVAIYRILQTAAGPFNILSATFMTSLGMRAWTLSDPEAVVRLRSRTMRLAAGLGAGAIVYYAAAFAVLTSISGLVGNPDVLRVAIVLGISGALGAATIPITAAASAMGFQLVGLIVRILVVVSAIFVSVLAASGAVIPWSDPVAVVTLVSGALGLAGWLVGYEIGFRRERREGSL